MSLRVHPSHPLPMPDAHLIRCVLPEFIVEETNITVN
jgi:hypothetical protein